jgi:hypothetical protein
MYVERTSHRDFVQSLFPPPVCGFFLRDYLRMSVVYDNLEQTVFASLYHRIHARTRSPITSPKPFLMLKRSDDSNLLFTAQEAAAKRWSCLAIVRMHLRF